MKFGIKKLLIMKSGRKKNNRRNKIAKSKKCQNAWKKGKKTQILGNLGRKYHQQ